MYFQSGRVFVSAVFFVGFLSHLSFAGLDQFDVSNSIVHLDEFMSGGPPKDGIPSLDKPHFVSARNAEFLRNDDQVAGLVIDGQAKAYPIRILNWHEIVNDHVSGMPVAVTWCPLTHSAVAFDRRVGSQTLEFGVSGLLYNSNVVMYDRQSQGLWSQLKIEGLTGKFAANTLETIPLQVIRWKDWRREYPGTLVLSKQTGHRRNYGRDPYAGYHSGSEVMFPTGVSDKQLPLKSLVAGIIIKGISKAYPLDKLARLNKPLNDQVGDVNIQIRSVKGGAVEVSERDGKILPSVVAYWFAWKAFHQDTLVYD